MGGSKDDICCKEEDYHLMVKCKAHIRGFENRECCLDEMAEMLYADLAEYLEKNGDDIENYDEEGVLMELERRILRWINKKMINFRNLTGYGFCRNCGALILAGRTKCSSCSGTAEIQSVLEQQRSLSQAAKPRGGMHSKS